MRIILAALMLSACTAQVDVYVDVDGDSPVFSWDGADMSELAVIAQDQDLTGRDEGTLMWAIECKPLESGEIPNCLRSPLAYGLVPMNADERVKPLPLASNVSYWVSTFNTPPESGSSVNGDGLFAML